MMALEWSDVDLGKRQLSVARSEWKGHVAKAIQELAGHQDLATTQRYMHLSPAALDAAIRLLDEGTQPSSPGNNLEEAGTVG